MKRRTLYLVLLFLPLLLPILIVAYGHYVDGYLIIQKSVDGEIHRPNTPSTAFNLSVTTFPISLLYIPFAAGVIWWGRNKTADQIKEMIGKFPLLFAPVFAVEMLLFVYLKYPENLQKLDTNDLLILIPLGVLVIAFGYFYVVLADILYWLLQKAGLVRD